MTTNTFGPDEDTRIVCVNQINLAMVRRAAEESSRSIARYCLHKSTDHPIQEMIIAYANRVPYPPHRHRGKTESFHLIEGSITMLLFDDDGTVEDAIWLQALGLPGHRGVPFLYRFEKDFWHAAVPMTDMVVLHEVTTGPFRPGEIIYPKWGPKPEKPDEVNAFINKALAQ